MVCLRACASRFLSQSYAVETYCAKLAGLYPEDTWTASLVDEVRWAAWTCPYVGGIALGNTEDNPKQPYTTQTGRSNRKHGKAKPKQP